MIEAPWLFLIIGMMLGVGLSMLLWLFLHHRRIAQLERDVAQLRREGERAARAAARQ